MKPSELLKYAEFCIVNRLNLLVVGAAGTGKSDVMAQAAANTGRRLLLSHPVVSDPVDYKGLPFASEVEIFTPYDKSEPEAGITQRKKVADFLPFGDLRQLIEAEEELVWDIEDLGQASVSVQAALMQILLAREVNGHKISDKVSIVATSNRKQDKAGVMGLLEPVKSRFRGGIIELNVNHTDWVEWAKEQENIPLELIAFIRFRPDIIDNPEPASKDLINTVSPRTLASVGMAQNAGIPEGLEHEAFAGIAGAGFAAEYSKFLKLMKHLPTLDEIIKNPDGAPVPKQADEKYALCAGLANKMTSENIEPIFRYLWRIEAEFRVMTIVDAKTRHGKAVSETKSFIEWANKEAHILNR